MKVERGIRSLKRLISKLKKIYNRNTGDVDEAALEGFIHNSILYDNILMKLYGPLLSAFLDEDLEMDQGLAEVLDAIVADAKHRVKEIERNIDEINRLEQKMAKIDDILIQTPFGPEYQELENSLVYIQNKINKTEEEVHYLLSTSFDLV